MRADPRLRGWKPADEQVSHLSADRAVALSELLDLPRRQHFVLLSGGSAGNIVRPLSTYRVNGAASQTRRDLVRAAEGGLARCLIYHASPENAFVGFGPVVGILDESAERDGDRGTCGGPLVVRLEVCRFARRAGG